MTGPTVLITMAGAGMRFREAGYATPKFAIQVRGRSIFSWALESLRSFYEVSCQWIFITREVDEAQAFIETETRSLGIPSPCVVTLSKMSDGQATTALLASDRVDNPGRPAMIYNIDTFVAPRFLPAEGPRGDGWIPCFPGKGDAWSFAQADDLGRVTELREKVRISPHATIGLYWFSSFTLYKSAYDEYYERAGRGSGERYVAPLYNQLVEVGREVYIHQVPIEGVYPLGTPADVERFADSGVRRG